MQFIFWIFKKDLHSDGVGTRLNFKTLFQRKKASWSIQQKRKYFQVMYPSYVLYIVGFLRNPNNIQLNF